jgi:hypothetical protein
LHLARLAESGEQASTWRFDRFPGGRAVQARDHVADETGNHQQSRQRDLGVLMHAEMPGPLDESTRDLHEPSANLLINPN